MKTTCRCGAPRMVIKSGKNAGKLRTYCSACESAMSRASKAKKGTKRPPDRDPAAAGPSNRDRAASPDSVVTVPASPGYSPPPGSHRKKPRKQATPTRKSGNA